MGGIEMGLGWARSFRISVLDSERFERAVECNAVGIMTMFLVNSKPAGVSCISTGPATLMLLM